MVMPLAASKRGKKTDSSMAKWCSMASRMAWKAFPAASQSPAATFSSASAKRPSQR